MSTPDSKIIPLLGPDRPVMGMRSAQDPSTLPAGIWSKLVNLRCQNGTLRVRDGSAAVVPVALEDADGLRGLYSATFDGVSRLFAAFRVGDETRVYWLNDDTWTEIEGTGTLLSTDRPLGFVVVHQEGIEGGVNEAGDVLIAGNGDQVVAISTDLSPFDRVASIAAVAQPSAVRQIPVPYGHQYMLSGFGATASRAYNSNSSKLQGANGIGLTGYTLTVKTSVSEGVLADIVWGLSIGVAPGGTYGLNIQKEICLATLPYDSGTRLWDYIKKVEALIWPADSALVPVSTAAASGAAITITTAAPHPYNTGDYVRITDVAGFSAANGIYRITKTSSTTFTLDDSSATGSGTGGDARVLEWSELWNPETQVGAISVFPLEVDGDLTEEDVPMMTVFSTHQLEGRRGWCGLRFTASGELPDASKSIEFMVAATSGQVDGRSQFAVGFYADRSFTEGIATLATPTTYSLRAFGETASGAQFTWNPNSNWRTTYTLVFPGSQTSAGNPSHALVYRSDPYLENDGSVAFDAYYFDTSLALPATEPAAENFVQSYEESLTVTRSAKDIGTLPMPPGSCFANANDRLYVGGIGSTSRAAELWISADRDPFHFRQTPIVDDSGNQNPLSATYRTFAGEKVTALLRLQGDLLGVDTLLLWTDRGLYRMGGFDSRTLGQAARLSEKGTRYPTTVAPYDGAVWYLDTEHQARRTNGGLAAVAVSEQRVDDLLRTAEVAGTSAVVGYGTFRLAFQPHGQSEPNHCLVWQERTQEWVLDRFPFGVAGLVVHEWEGRRKILACEANGKLWELEKVGQTADGAQPIRFEMHGGEISNGLWEGLSFGSIGIVCDGNVQTHLETSRWIPYTGQTTDGTIDLSAEALQTASAWRWDVLEGGGIPATETCFSCIPGLQGNLPGGKRIRAMVIKASSRTGGADRV